MLQKIPKSGFSKGDKMLQKIPSSSFSKQPRGPDDQINLIDLLAEAKKEDAELLMLAKKAVEEPLELPEPVVTYKRLSETWEYALSSSGGSDSGRGGGKDTGGPTDDDAPSGKDNGANQDDVKIDGTRRDLLNKVYWLVAIISLVVGAAYLYVILAEYCKFSGLLHNGTNLADYKLMYEAAKVVSDAALTRLGDVVKILIGILIGIFIKLVDELGKKNK
jgi:hypothetical protein